MGLKINGECDFWHVLHCNQNLMIFKKLVKKVVTFVPLGYYLQREMGTNISLPHKKGSQGYPKWNFNKPSKKNTHTFLLPLPQTKMDINVFMGN